MKQKLFLTAFLLSVCLQQGFAVDISDLKKKAEKGDPKAQLELGRAYMAGDSIKEDTREGAKWIMKAADQKNKEAQFYLGVCYTYGFGVFKNPKKAVDLLNGNANEENSESVKVVWDAYDDLLESGYFKKSDDQMEKGERARLIKWIFIAADKGIPKAQAFAASILRDGAEEYGVDKDKHKAAKLMRAAAQGGDKNAVNLVEMYEYEAMNPVQRWIADRKKEKLAEEKRKKILEIQKKRKESEVADLLREIRDQNAELLEAVRESSEQSASRPNVVYVNDNSGDDLRREFKDSVDELRNDIDRAAMWDAMQSRLRSE